MLHPNDVDAKSEKTVVEVLDSKHPSCMIPQLGEERWVSFEDYDEQLNSVPVDYNQEIVQKVADKMQGGAGPSSVEGQALSSWLLKFGKKLSGAVGGDGGMGGMAGERLPALGRIPHADDMPPCRPGQAARGEAPRYR